jgi:hypothetical protein
MTILSETIVSDELPRTTLISAAIMVTCETAAETSNPNVNRAPLTRCGRLVFLVQAPGITRFCDTASLITGGSYPKSFPSRAKSTRPRPLAAERVWEGHRGEEAGRGA